MEWEVKLSSAALKQVLTFPPRYFLNDKSARESTEFERPASLTVLFLKKARRKTFQAQNGYRSDSARERRNLTRIQNGPYEIRIQIQNSEVLPVIKVGAQRSDTARDWFIDTCQCCRVAASVSCRRVPMRMGKWNNGRLGPHPARESDTTLATLWIQFFN